MAGPALAAAIAAGGQLIGTGINALQTGNLNRKNRQFSLDMYQRQYNDNTKFWELQNEYNDPAQQMERYRNAGLNPNLIYGTGTASAGNAGSISTPDVQPVNYRTTDVSGIGNAANAIARYQDFEIKQAQSEGLRLDNQYKQIRNVTAGYDSDNKLIDWNVKNYKANSRSLERGAREFRRSRSKRCSRFTSKRFGDIETKSTKWRVFGF